MPSNSQDIFLEALAIIKRRKDFAECKSPFIYWVYILAGALFFGFRVIFLKLLFDIFRKDWNDPGMAPEASHQNAGLHPFIFVSYSDHFKFWVDLFGNFYCATLQERPL